MQGKVGFVLLVTVLLSAAVAPAFSGQVNGQVTRVVDDLVAATFPVPVHPRSVMVILSGNGDSVAGMGVSEMCRGNGPYEVTGRIMTVMDPLALTAGKTVYVNAINTDPAPSVITPTHVAPYKGGPVDQDLKLDHYATGQTVGYGALGVGYDRTIKLSRSLGFELDGGLSGVGDVKTNDAKNVGLDQLTKSADARLKVDFGPWFGTYTAYRWSEAQGDSENLQALQNELQGKTFVAASQAAAGTVITQGLEYGLTLRPAKRLTLSAGYIPSLRADYGSFGVRSEPGYSAELRFTAGRGAVRLRGITSDGYWLGDLGITIY